MKARREILTFVKVIGVSTGLHSSGGILEKILLLMCRPVVFIFSFILLQTTVLRADSEFSNEIKLKSRNILSSDVDAQNGDIKIYESEFEFNHEWKIADQWPVDFSGPLLCGPIPWQHASKKLAGALSAVRPNE